MSRTSRLSTSGLTQQRVQELLDYDCETGIFRWKQSYGRAVKGVIAGNAGVRGYRYIGIDAGFFRAHHVAWLYVHGTATQKEIDHINGNRDDNRITNLRECSRAQNMENKKPYARRKGNAPQGVHWHIATNKWCAAIQKDRHRHHLGLFDTADAAHNAYLEAKRALHTFQPEVRG